MKQTPATKKRNFGKTQQWIFYWAILILPLLHFCIFYIGALFNSATLPFKGYDYSSGKLVWDSGFANLKLAMTDLFTQNFFQHALKNSAILYITGVIVGTVGALLFSYYIYKKRLGSEFFKTMLFMPQIVSGITLVIMYRYFVDRGIPTIIQLISGKEVEGLIASVDTRFGAILFFTLFAGFGTQVLMYTGAMSGISDSVIDAAKIDGMSSICEFLHIVVPSIWNTIVTFLVVGVAGFFTGQMNLYSFYGQKADYELYTFGYFLYKKVQGATSVDYPYVATFGLFFTLIAVPITLMFKHLLEKYGPRTE